MMKRNLTLLFLSIVFTTGAWALEQDGEGCYLLGTVQDWKDFAALVQTTPTANAKMTADIDLGDCQAMLGDSEHEDHPTYSYQGTFDGQGHTLTVHYTGTSQTAPFAMLEAATIKNIHVDGTIYNSSGSQPAVIARVIRGTTTVENVWSSVITADTRTGWDEAAAFVGCVDGYKSGRIVMHDCLFTGTVNSSGSYNGCFVGFINSGGSANVSNCLSLGTFNYTGGSYDIARGTYSNCFVKQWPSTIPAEMQVSDEQLSDGTITAALQNNREETVWFQDPVTNQPMLKVFTLNQGNEPHTHTPANAVEENVSPVTCTQVGGYDLVVYCSECGEELSREHLEIAALGHDYRWDVHYPSCEEAGYTIYTCLRCGVSYVGDETSALGHSWGEASYVWAEDNSQVMATHTCERDASHEESQTVQTISKETKAPTSTESGEITYTATFTMSGFTTQTKIVTVPPVTTDYLLIASADDWKAFAELVKTTPTANAKMTADINLGDDQTMVGTEEHPYQGTFDGQGYTLTVAYNVTEDYVAPFRFIDGATIQNLHVEGTINTTAWYAGGVVGNIPAGNNCIKNTQSSVNITGNYTGGGSQVDWHGGIVGQATSGAIINLSDCFFDGSIKGSSSDCSFCANMIGIMRNSGEAYINSCLSMASFTDVYQVNSMYHYMYGSGSTSNSYVLTGTTATDHGRAGTLITTDDLTSGTTVTALQAGRDEIVWVQNPVTNAPSLKVIAEKATSTAINAVGYSQSPFGNKQSWYTINGQRVMKPTNGIYVKDGKKVIVR